MFEDVGRSIGRSIDDAIYNFQNWYCRHWWYRRLFSPVFLFFWYHIKGLSREQIEILHELDYLTDKRYAKLINSMEV